MAYRRLDDNNPVKIAKMMSIGMRYKSGKGYERRVTKMKNCPRLWKMAPVTDNKNKDTRLSVIQSMSIMTRTDNTVPDKDTSPATNPRVIRTKRLFMTATTKASRLPKKRRVAMTAMLDSP